jgi:inner membrane protein
MDNLCHTLVGAAMGEAGLKQRTRFGNPVLMMAANLPDVDALAFVFDTPAVAIRRGWTHGVLAQALLPIVLTVMVLAVERWRRRAGPGPPARAGAILLLSYAGVLSHVALDYLNNYGVRLLMPFSPEWFYGDAVFIIDPWLWLALGGGVLLARRRARARPALIALAAATLYVGLMLASASAARTSAIAQWTAARGRAPEAIMVGPVFANPLRKTVIVDEGDRYATGAFTWPDGRLRLNGRTVPTLEDQPPVRRARTDPTIAAVLVWARFPYYEVSRGGPRTRVSLRDMRFGERVGAVTVTVPE